jgi:hypothetical protein
VSSQVDMASQSTTNYFEFNNNCIFCMKEDQLPV